MDGKVNKDWKKSVGFPINYSSPSTDDEFDCKDVVFRNPQHSSKFLLADNGDGAEADLLGTTPPRSRIRDKERGKKKVDLNSTPGAQRLIREKKEVLEHNDQGSPISDRLKKRHSMKVLRTRARDSKLDMSQDTRADSVPTLVESCDRFMSLTSRPKSRECSSNCTTTSALGEVVGEERWRCDGDEDLPPSRVNFHKTFSLLINMGNIEKGCKRAISREEQVWQNELKDLIWLELQAKLAGRTLAQQDAYLCAQRNVVPAIIKNVCEYRFFNADPCRPELHNDSNSQEDLTSDKQEDEQNYGCLSFHCQRCSDAIGKAMKEVGALMDSFYNAVSLYPSSRNMTVEHPQIATPAFNNRIKAMCLWYNTALHIRMKMLLMRRMLRSIRLKSQRRLQQRTSTDSNMERQSSESRPSHVRFDLPTNPSDSSGSDSAHSDIKEGSLNYVKEEKVEEASEDKEDQGKDDTDNSGVDVRNVSGTDTPEIVISDNYGTHESTESGYGSSVGNVCDSAPSSDTFDHDTLEELTHLRLLDKCNVSLYRDYHREILKTQGVRRCMMFIYKMRTHLLDKVYLTLEPPNAINPDTPIAEDEEEVFDNEEDMKDENEQSDSQDEDEMKTYELRRYGCWSEECLSMRLPSYRSHFLLLSSICMEAVHDYLSFRLESRPEHPSCLTVKQLIHELREGLDISSEMRADFARHVRAALAGRPADPKAAKDLLLLARTFDDTVETMLKQYLSYLTTMSETELMPRARLQAEWAFTAQLAGRIKCAAVLAPVTFSNITCNQLNRLLKQFEMIKADEDIDPDRHSIYLVCRSAQSMYARWREAALHAAHWARALAARLARAPPPAYLRERAAIFDCLMSIRDFIVRHIQYILKKSKLEDVQIRDESVITRVRELLLQVYKLGFELHKELYKFVHAQRLNEELSMRRMRPISLQHFRSPVVERRRRPETMIVHDALNPMMHKELHRFVNESPARPGPAPRRPSAPAKPRLFRAESIVDEYENSVFDERVFENIHYFEEKQTQSSIELLLSGEQPKSEDEAELRAPVFRSASREEKLWAARVARAIIQFARCWMGFVVERCDRGRGLRPRWASQGLEFLMLACDPRNTKHLSDEEFEELKSLMDGCISHVVGSRPVPQATAHSPRPRPRLPSPFPSNNSPRDMLTPSTPPAEPEQPDLGSPYPDSDADNDTTMTTTASRRRRVVRAAQAADRGRDERLRAARRVGRVLRAAPSAYEPRLRQLTFKWQRGLKIGAGTFGKVYTVVNTESGQLLAMKELSVGVGDRRALQRAVNELRVLEGVIHPHLVRYYGCELHREEMLIFMELCVEGSLEALVATSGALAEHTVRKYTKQLVSAVTELHARSIAHRDIKSGNIFLTNEGHCLKLGDFGCAVKIRNNTTAPGELQGFVGTQAYMAPEVFMKTSGHGRAADIWSLGCVVTEMASGKRPFYQYDSNYQIMFLVGSGGRPEISTTLSEEGQQFCMSCLTHDPDLRPRAEALTLHHFLMVKNDDCKCEPAYLMT